MSPNQKMNTNQMEINFAIVAKRGHLLYGGMWHVSVAAVAGDTRRGR